MGTSSANLCLRQGVLALPWPCDVALREDALTLLRSLPDRLHAAGLLRSAISRGARQACLRQRGGAPARALRIAGDDERLHRRMLPRDRAGAAAERLSDALERHLPPLRGCPPARRRCRQVRRSDLPGTICGRATAIAAGGAAATCSCCRSRRCARRRRGAITVSRTGGRRRLIAESTRTRSQPA